MKKKILFLGIMIGAFFSLMTISASALTLPTSDQGCSFCRQTWKNYEKDVHCDAICECTFEQCPYCGENTILIYCARAHYRYYANNASPSSNVVVPCTHCGVESNVKASTFKAHNHSPTRVVVPPTCFSYGYAKNICGVSETCVYSQNVLSISSQGSRVNFTEPIAEHDLAYVETVETSCTGHGYDKYICNVCSCTFEFNIVPALDHIPSDEGVYNPPSCAYKGYTLHTCSVCSSNFKVDFVDALGHQYELDCTLRSDYTLRVANKCTKCNLTVDISDYCTNYSSSLYSCDCGLGTDAPWNGLEFDHSTEHQKNYVDFCNDCGASVAFFVSDTHDLHVEMIDDVAYDVCSVCDYSAVNEKYDPDDPGGSGGNSTCAHEISATVIAPTCQTRGFTFLECVKCGYSESVDFVDPVSHSYIAVGKVDPTCTNSGMIQYVCVYCDVLSGDGYLAPLGHNWEVVSSIPSDDGMITTNSKCTRCQETKAETFPTEAAQAQNWLLTCLNGLFDGFTDMYNILANGIEIGGVTLGMVVTAVLIVIVLLLLVALGLKILG